MKNLELNVLQFKAEDVIATSGLCAYLGGTHAYFSNLNATNNLGKITIYDTSVDRAPVAWSSYYNRDWALTDTTKEADIVTYGEG